MNTAQRAQLALLLEVASTPKPGNVDRAHDYPELRFEHFLAGAVGVSPGLTAAMEGDRVGRAFEAAVAGMAEQDGGNTQFGALLLVAPLVSTTSTARALTPETASTVVESTSVADACDFYRAFDHVEVAVDDPPDGMAALDVRRGSAAVSTLQDQQITLYDIMDASADRDGVAREWITGFDRSFDAADRIAARAGPIPDRAADVFLELLAEEPDTFIQTQHDKQTAVWASERALDALSGDPTPSVLADEFVEKEINPGTTADIIAAGLYIGLERGTIHV